MVREQAFENVLSISLGISLGLLQEGSVIHGRSTSQIGQSTLEEHRWRKESKLTKPLISRIDPVFESLRFRLMFQLSNVLLSQEIDVPTRLNWTCPW